MPQAERVEWFDHIVASRLQTIRDVATARMGTVAVIAGDEDATPLIDALVDSALASGFAVATASLAENGLQDLHAVVGALAASMRAPRVEAGRRHGVIAALDAFASAHGRSAEALFEESADEEAVGGELCLLACECIASNSGTGAARKLQAWLGGRDVARDTDELRPLSERTAKRALADLTRLVRALGHRGTRIVLRDAEALIDLSPGRRDVAYTVLREIIDNADGGHGVVGCETLLVGTRDLDRRVHSLFDHPALATRIVADVPPGPPIPHQTWISLSPDDPSALLPPVPKPFETSERHASQLAALVRITQGLPPVEAVPDLTVGMEEVDARIAELFETASNDGSVFAVLLGEYGAGKTHHLLHLEARALAERRPVLRLAVERLDEDLGNPQRHLRRLIENATFPGKRPMRFLERLDAWLAKPAARKRLRHALDAVFKAHDETERPAARAVAYAPDDDVDDEAVREIFGALDLVDKPSSPSYRKDAYARLQLWLDVLERLEGCAGPVLILDEAENLYRSGVSRTDRRTALRSLAHYCGGALPRATVVLAVTPDTLEALREEAGALLDEIEEQATLLPSEDVSMLRRRLLRARPIRVKKLGPSELEALAEQARSVARDVRGKHVDRNIGAFLERAVKDSDTPRDLLRRVMLREERIAWLDDAGDR
jgi:hypothetical protein